MNRLDIYKEATDTLAENGQFEPGEKEELKTQLGEAKVRQNVLLNRLKVFDENPQVLELFSEFLKEREVEYEKILRTGNLRDGSGEYAQGALAMVDRIRKVVPDAKADYDGVSVFIADVEDRLKL